MKWTHLGTLLLVLVMLATTACDKGETKDDKAPTTGASSAPADKPADNKGSAPAADKPADGKASAPADNKAPAAADKPDHSKFNGLLQKFVTDKGLVKYKDWKGDAASVKALGEYVKWAADVDPSKWGDKDRLAFFINAYNANTIKAVLDNYPLKSVMDVKGFFDKLTYKVAGEELTLNDLEAKKIREPFKEPRIHFVVNCASASCPVIRNQALTAENAEELMEAGTKQYVLQETKVKGKTIDTSKIFEWYADDFKVAGGVNAFLAKYMPDQAKAIKAGTVKAHEYGWTLNEAK